jgi:cytoskeletal protein CcmA (bactofilin family)
MKTKLAALIAGVFFMNMAVSAMVIHNDAKEEEGNIRTEAGIFNEDYLYLGNELHFSGESEDLVFLGKRLTFNGKTKLGLFGLGENLMLSGGAGNGILAAGANILVDGTINGNSYVGCKSFHLAGPATMNGNLFAGCAKLTIDGNFNGDLYAGTGKLEINNVIHGNVTAYAGRIIFGDKGRIDGNLKYYSKEKLNEAALTHVAGTVTLDESMNCDKDAAMPAKFKHWVGPLIGAALFVSFVIVGLLLLFLPAFSKLDTEQSERTFWKTALWGLVPVLMYPAVIVLCFALVVTIPFAFVLLLAMVPLFFFASVIGTTLLGKYLVMKLKWKVTKRQYQFLIGAGAFALLSLIPFVNCLSMLLLCAIGWGVYISFLFKKNLASEA